LAGTFWVSFFKRLLTTSTESKSNVDIASILKLIKNPLDCSQSPQLTEPTKCLNSSLAEYNEMSWHNRAKWDQEIFFRELYLTMKICTWNFSQNFFQHIFQKITQIFSVFPKIILEIVHSLLREIRRDTSQIFFVSLSKAQYKSKKFIFFECESRVSLWLTFL
jgi:hypothetical protein